MGKKSGRERWLRILKQLHNPPNWVAVLVVATALVVCPLIILSLTLDYGDTMYAVVACTLCALLLIYTVAVVVNGIVKFRRKVRKVAGRYEFTRNLFESYEFRTVAFATYTFLCNVGYTVFLILMALLYHSVWYGTIGIYYLLLCVVRGGVLLQNRKDEKRYKEDFHKLQTAKVGTYRYCGVMMLVLALSLALSVVELVVDSSGFRHPVWLIYVFGGVAVYKVILAVVHLVHSTKRDDLVIRSVRYINMAVTLMSVLCLQTSIVAAFPIEGNTVAWLNGSTGALVCLVTLGLGLYMLLFSVRAKKRLLAQEVALAEMNDPFGYYE